MKIKQTKSAGGVVLNKNGQVAVVSQHGISWSLPKGHIEGDEVSIDTAKREIQEKTGIKQLKFIKTLGEYKRYGIALDGGDKKSEMKTIFMFLFSTDEDNLEPQDPENPTAKWVSKKDVAGLLTHKKDKAFFEKIINEIK